MSGNLDARLPGKGNSNSHRAMPVHPIIVDSVQWIDNKEVSRCRVSHQPVVEAVLGQRQARDGRVERGKVEHEAPRGITAQVGLDLLRPLPPLRCVARVRILVYSVMYDSG